MSIDRAQEIADAVLYEGYILYPYRPSALKNRQRWTFGAVFPHAFGDAAGDSCIQQTQVLLRAGIGARLDVHVRFLQAQTRELGRLAAPAAVRRDSREPSFEPVTSIEIGGKTFIAWDEAIERAARLSGLTICNGPGAQHTLELAWDRKREIEYLCNAEGEAEGVVIRTSLPVQGRIGVSVEQLPDAPEGLVRVTVKVENISALERGAGLRRDLAQRQAFLSTHAILKVQGGAFISLLDPPEELRAVAAACDNKGVWPVLAGEEGTTDTILSSPIILYDYPRIAPESPGLLFDGTEIDELLALRILALTEDEKREMAAADSRARAVLESCEAMTPEQFARLHGTFRSAPIAKRATGINVGAKVRLNPRPGGDILDMALKGRLATIESIERDLEDRVHVAVTLVDDPGRDLGAAGFPGHRFFFAQEEVEPIASGEPT